ncbi:hypothetical protein BCR35DRAFT_306437 [Leucosporidium creatinivorum]|uniref:Metal homeostatis protein bsd2 n=1 Tax=Leucosporidium creatinivorum TaxID=106004 RepID=A0A1Y2EUS8_9BASI|nr:hypothetical protein BCR35DRAFT_306437 [Leucosporidium creatinivorum]
MSLSYLRFGGSSSSRSNSTSLPTNSRGGATQPDFGAFDSDDDDDEDGEGEEDAPILSSTAASRPPTNTTTTTHQSISLGSDLIDPLTSHSASSHSSSPNHHQPSAPSPARIPGAYDFEPQGHEGGNPILHGQRRSSLSSGTTDDDGLGGGRLGALTSSAGGAGGGGASYRRPLSLRERLLPSALYARLSQRPTTTAEGDEQSSGLLFSHDGDGHDSSSSDAEGGGTSYPPRGTPSHVPLPARPPQFAAPAGAAPGGGGGRVFGGGQGNDGVFANLSAKPDGVNGGDYVGGDEGDNKDEVLPAYEVAAMDTTPPYWETTVITPGGVLGPDDICVDGLPVGNLFGFAWNLLVSMSFQFVGFLLTYLLHTTHAAKNGSRAGLGITLIQLGFYLKQRAEHPELDFPGDATGLDGSLGPGSTSSTGAGGVNDINDPNNWSWWGGVSAPSSDTLPSSTASALGSLPTQLHGALSGVLDASDPDIQEAMRNGSMPSLTGQISQEEMMRMSTAANEWMAFMMVTVGSFLVIGAVLSYWRAVRSVLAPFPPFSLFR